MTEVQLFGGPWDGRRLEVPAGHNAVVLPWPGAMFQWPADSDREFPRCRYRRRLDHPTAWDFVP